MNEAVPSSLEDDDLVRARRGLRIALAPDGPQPLASLVEALFEELPGHLREQAEWLRKEM